MTANQTDTVPEVVEEQPAPPPIEEAAELNETPEPAEPESEAREDQVLREGRPVGQLAVGGASGAAVVLGMLYQLTGVPGLVGGAVTAGWGTLAVVRHRQGKPLPWPLGQDDRARSRDGRSTSAFRSHASPSSAKAGRGSSVGSLLGRGGGRRASGGSPSRGLGLGLGRTSAAGKSAGGAAGKGTSAAGRKAAPATAGKRGRRADGSADTAHGSVGPIRRGARAFGRLASATGRGVGHAAGATGRATSRAAKATGRGARRAGSLVNEKAGAPAAKAARAVGRAAKGAAIWADRKTGRRVSAAYRAATTGKEQSFRARRRRAAAVLGWHGPVTGPVLALVAVLVDAWRRRKARKKATAETTSKDSPETPRDDEAKGWIITEPATAECPRCGRKHTVTLADDEDERIVTCPCGQVIRFARDLGQFDPPEEKSPAEAAPQTSPPTTTSTYTRRKYTMAGFPLVAAAADMNAAAASHAPADMWQIARELDQLPEVPAHVAMSYRTYTQRLQSDYPIHPTVVEKIHELYVRQAELTQLAEEIGTLFRTVHADDLRRDEAPRTNEQAWNV